LVVCTSQIFTVLSSEPDATLYILQNFRAHLENLGKMRSVEDKNKISTKFARNAMISSKVKPVYRASSSRVRRRRS
jgi:hypothetical protein